MPHIRTCQSPAPDSKQRFPSDICGLNARKSAPYADIISFNRNDSLFEFVVFMLILQTV